MRFLLDTNIVSATTLVAVTFTLAAYSHAAETTLPPHPRLLLNQSEIDALKIKIAGPFADQWARWRAEAEKLCRDPINLPPRGGNWSHNYVCPEHGARLKRGKAIGPWQWEHICPVGNHILHGDPSKGVTDFDGNAIAEAHANYAEATVTLGVAFRVTGDARYANRAKAILLAYADKYRSYPLHDNKGVPGGKGGGHVASQSLTEASWLIPITHGTDLIWDQLTQSDRAAITEKILRPALDEVILPREYGIHNIQCRHNSAIGLVGLLLGDEQLIAKAIDDPKLGFRQQIARGVQDDGMWLEGSAGYHFFTIVGLEPLAEAARHCNIDLYSPRFKTMFDAPLALAMPDLRLPNFNDSGIVDITRYADDYELAYARWKDPAYLRILSTSKRTGRNALLYGAATLNTQSAPTPPPVEADSSSASHNSPASGYAILRSDTTPNATWLCVKYGPHGGGHGHPDKNTFILYANHQIVAADAGTHAYGSPLHTGWDKTTLAHNTLVVDETSQSPATGKCLTFGRDAGIDYVMTDAGPIYPGKKVSFIRTLAMLDSQTILGIDHVTTADGKDHTLDLAFHLPGSWSAQPAGQPWTAPPKTPYTFIQPASQVSITDSTTLTINNHDHPVSLTLLPTAATQLIAGAGVGESTSERIPAAIFRRIAARTTYVWAIGLREHPPKFAGLSVTAESLSFSIDNIMITVHPDEAHLIIETPRR
jgi:oligo-alginate lyase